MSIRVHPWLNFRLHRSLIPQRFQRIRESRATSVQARETLFSVPLPRSASAQTLNEIERTTIAVQCVADRIDVLVNGHEAARVNDTSFTIGQVGMAAFGKGRAVFNNLYVEERPE